MLITRAPIIKRSPKPLTFSILFCSLLLLVAPIIQVNPSRTDNPSSATCSTCKRTTAGRKLSRARQSAFEILAKLFRNTQTASSCKPPKPEAICSLTTSARCIATSARWPMIKITLPVKNYPQVTTAISDQYHSRMGKDVY